MDLMKDVTYDNVVVGSLMYGMVCTRPDLSYAISVVSKLMVDPGGVH